MTRLQARFLLSFFAAIVIAPLAADAADLYRAPPAPPYAPPAAYVDLNSWTGFYAGINGSYGWNSGGNSIGYNDGGAGFIGGTDQSVAGGGVEFKINAVLVSEGRISVYRPWQSDSERHRHDRCFGHGHGSRNHLLDRTPWVELPLRWRTGAFEMI